MLSTPQRTDPVGTLATRFAIAGLLGLAAFASVYQIDRPNSAEAGTNYTVINATATPSLPTAVPLAPALGELAQPTPAPAGGSAEPGQLPAPIWPADMLAAPVLQDQAPAEVPAEVSPSGDYIANVGAQAEHSPRGGDPQPPPAQTGPILMPGSADQAPYIVAPAGSADAPAPAPPSIAVAVPPISSAQAEVIGARTSNTCAPGQVFMPRSGCYTPGQGGAMPGAVGAP